MTNSTAWESELELWRKLVVERLIRFFILPTTVLVIIAKYFEASPAPWSLVLFCCAALIILSFVPQIPPRARSIGLCVTIFIMGVSVALVYGIPSASRLYLAMAVILAGIFISTRAGVLFMLCSVVALAVCGWLIVTGIFTPVPQAMPRSGEPATWVLFILIYLFSIGPTLTVVLFLIQRLQTNFEKMNQLLEETQTASDAATVSSRNFETLANNSTDVIWTSDLNLKMTYMSPSVERIRGFTVDELLAMDRGGHFDKETAAFFTSVLEAELENDENLAPDRSSRFESKLLCKDGSLLDVEIVVGFLRDSAGKPSGLVGVTRDISERKQLDAAMESVLQGTRRTTGSDFFKSLVENLARVLEVNSVLLGELRNNDTIHTLAVWIDGVVVDNISYLAEGTPSARIVEQGALAFTGNIQQHFPDDKNLIDAGMESCIGVPLIGSNDEVVGVLLCMDKKPIVKQQLVERLIGIFASYAEGELAKRAAERSQESIRTQLIQSQKLESVGQLAGGIAHDFNNLLVVIQGYIDLASDGHSENPQLRNYHREIRKAADRAAALTRQLLSFSRRQILQIKPLDLNELVTGIGGLLSRLLPEYIEQEFIPGAGLGIIEGDPGQLEQAIVNLAVNARDAMPNGGKLTIETENVLIDQSFVDSHSWARVGRFVLLRVADTGIGISTDMQQRIFEPFFTTKPEGEGTGLGLSVYFGVVTQHHGFANLYSEPGKGSEFRTYLPIVERKIASVEKKLQAGVSRGSETLLLVEDEPQILTLAETFLTRAGYTVISAVDGESAIEEFKAHRADLSLVVLDVVLPRMGGREVRDIIHKACPEMPVLFTSGYSADGIHTNFTLQEDLELLQKPYSRNDLLRKIREMIDSLDPSGD
ncbi:MAG: response regulator [Halieaceae bacterium]|jgi:PAS domain S-box-containing protein|nr:response regulator [Halieaceae bacterium]